MQLRALSLWPSIHKRCKHWYCIHVCGKKRKPWLLLNQTRPTHHKVFRHVLTSMHFFWKHLLYWHSIERSMNSNFIVSFIFRKARGVLFTAWSQEHQQALRSMVTKQPSGSTGAPLIDTIRKGFGGSQLTWRNSKDSVCYCARKKHFTNAVQNRYPPSRFGTHSGFYPLPLSRGGGKESLLGLIWHKKLRTWKGYFTVFLFNSIWENGGIQP